MLPHNDERATPTKIHTKQAKKLLAAGDMPRRVSAVLPGGKCIAFMHPHCSKNERTCGVHTAACAPPSTTAGHNPPRTRLGDGYPWHWRVTIKVPGGVGISIVPFPHPYPSHPCGPGDNGCGECGCERVRVRPHPLAALTLMHHLAHLCNLTVLKEHRNLPKAAATSELIQRVACDALLLEGEVDTTITLQVKTSIL